MEHLSTFGLTRDPFANEPQLDGWFASPAHLEADRRLSRAVRQSKGLVLLLGEGGSGKTLLVRRLLESLEEEMFEACMLVPLPGVSDGPWLMNRLARQMGEEAPAAEPDQLLAQLYDHLATVREDGRHTVVLVDEAQVLADAGVLPMLRGLLNLEYEDRRLLTLVLTGPPELGEAVAREPALASRVEARVSLSPMDGQSSADYLRHRIRDADGNPAILESGSVDALVKCGGGIPRRLNDLADGSLFEAHVAGRVSATAEDVARAVVELGLEPSEPLARGATSEPLPIIEPPLAPAAMQISQDTGAPSADGPNADPEDLSSLLADRREDGNALTEVVASDTSPPRGAPDATVALLDGEPIGAEPRSAPAANPNAAETVALFAETTEADPASDGDLDDLFADLVDD